MLEIRPRLLGGCTILVGDTEVTPAASHLFALLLAFALAPREPWTRRRLQELLFAGTDDRQANHRLRQLLYRLRGFGVVLQESSTGVIRLGNPVADPLLEDQATLGDAALGAHPVPDPLALYAPRMPAAFLDWLEHRRDALRAQLATRRLATLRAARERQEWGACIRLATALRHDDTTSEDVAAILAESHAMLGRRDTAVDIIDQFVREGGGGLDAYPTMRRLRTRVLSTRIPRREGTLRGREECLSLLADQWAQATSGRGGRACAIFGPPGMGKTRVGESFAATVRLGGGQVIQHRADDHVRAFPLALFSELVPDLRRRRGSIGADPALARVLDDIAPHVVPSTAGIAPAEERRDEMRRAIVDLLEAVSAEQPMLVVVDDAHLLDDASRAVIRSLADSANSAQVLVLLLCRPRPDTHNLLSASPRFASYVLPPLGEADSRALLLELCGETRPSEEEVRWAVEQAEGNAFYLNALAQHRGARVSLPAHIGSLAQTSYFGLSADARTVLEASLLLDTLATPGRVLTVAAVGERVVLSALRELEQSDLLCYQNGLFVGPHAILKDALVELVPSTARAVLHRRIAELLSTECADFEQAKVVAWTAVNSWLATGDPIAAVRLALQVARHTAAVGEPQAGAILLSQIPRDRVSVELQRELLDEAILLADAGKCIALLAALLRERAFLAARTTEGSSSVASLRIRAAAHDEMIGIRPDVKELDRILYDPAVSPPERADAAGRLLAQADLLYDREWAESTMNALRSLETDASEPTAHRKRAELIFHVGFGSVDTAIDIIEALRNEVAQPSLEPQNRQSSSYVAMGLLKLGLFRESLDFAFARYGFMVEKGNLNAAEYFGAIAAEAMLCCGEYQRARKVYADVSAMPRTATGEIIAGSGLCSAGISLALLDRDPNKAEHLLEQTSQSELITTSPRLRSVMLSLRIQASVLRGTNFSAERDELETLYEDGAPLGGQDNVVAALWAARALAGEHAAASKLLMTYFDMRRELGPLDFRLVQQSANDLAWKRFPQRQSTSRARTSRR